MTSTANSNEWGWPPDIPKHDQAESQQGLSLPGSFDNDSGYLNSFHNNFARSTAAPNTTPKPTSKPTPKPSSKPKHWLPRTCRICLETVVPTFHQPSESVPGILQPNPDVTYDSEDPASGRLLRPCKCKGSSKYVHEGCLQQWRHSDPGYGKRNYWQCPTCGFRYRLQRMKWGRWISSTACQIVLTFSIFFLAIFIFGFVADPIINLYLDPYSTLFSTSKLGAKLEPILTDDGVTSWTEHFLKGLASLGLLSFVKFLFALSPWQWWNLRQTGIMSGSGRAGNTGRDRLQNISWVVVLVGVGTFLWVCTQYSNISRFRLITLRLYTKVFVIGAVEYLKRLENLSWMLPEMKTMRRLMNSLSITLLFLLLKLDVLDAAFLRKNVFSETPLFISIAYHTILLTVN